MIFLFLMASSNIKAQSSNDLKRMSRPRNCTSFFRSNFTTASCIIKQTISLFISAVADVSMQQCSLIAAVLLYEIYCWHCIHHTTLVPRRVVSERAQYIRVFWKAEYTCFYFV